MKSCKRAPFRCYLIFFQCCGSAFKWRRSGFGSGSKCGSRSRLICKQISIFQLFYSKKIYLADGPTKFSLDYAQNRVWMYFFPELSSLTEFFLLFQHKITFYELSLTFGSGSATLHYNVKKILKHAFTVHALGSDESKACLFSCKIV